MGERTNTVVYMGILSSFLTTLSNTLKLRENKIPEMEKVHKTCDFYECLPSFFKFISSMTKALIRLANIEQDLSRVRIQDNIVPMEISYENFQVKWKVHELVAHFLCTSQPNSYKNIIEINYFARPNF